jgi:hypothetical protein
MGATKVYAARPACREAVRTLAASALQTAPVVTRSPQVATDRLPASSVRWSTTARSSHPARRYPGSMAGAEIPSASRRIRCAPTPPTVSTSWRSDCGTRRGPVAAAVCRARMSTRSPTCPRSAMSCRVLTTARRFPVLGGHCARPRRTRASAEDLADFRAPDLRRTRRAAATSPESAAPAAASRASAVRNASLSKPSPPRYDTETSLSGCGRGRGRPPMLGWFAGRRCIVWVVTKPILRAIKRPQLRLHKLLTRTQPLLARSLQRSALARPSHQLFCCDVAEMPSAGMGCLGWVPRTWTMLKSC